MPSENGAVYIHDSDEGSVYIKLASVLGIVETTEELPDSNVTVIQLTLCMELMPQPLIIRFPDNDLGDKKRNKFIDAWAEIQNHELYGLDIDED